jgi:hypothetical protein
MRELGCNGAAEDSSPPEHYAVLTGKVTDISKEHNASVFCQAVYEHFLDTSPDDQVNHKGRSTEFCFHSRKHLKKKSYKY